MRAIRAAKLRAHRRRMAHLRRVRAHRARIARARRARRQAAWRRHAAKLRRHAAYKQRMENRRRAVLRLAAKRAAIAKAAGLTKHKKPCAKKPKLMVESINMVVMRHG